MNKRMAAVITLAGVIGTGTIAHAQQYETTLTPQTEGPQTLEDWRQVCMIYRFNYWLFRVLAGWAEQTFTFYPFVSLDSTSTQWLD